MVSPNKSSLINILRDPHYQMVGVVLDRLWLGQFYVERIRRIQRGYWVNVIPANLACRAVPRGEGVSCSSGVT